MKTINFPALYLQRKLTAKDRCISSLCILACIQVTAALGFKFNVMSEILTHFWLAASLLVSAIGAVCFFQVEIEEIMEDRRERRLAMEGDESDNGNNVA